MQLKQALTKAFELSNYTINSQSKLTEENIINAFCECTSSEDMAKYLGYASGKTLRTGLKRIFFDKDDSLHYKTWLLAKINMKQCGSCKEVFSFTEFNCANNKAIGLQSSCKKCDRELSLIWAKENPDKANFHNATRRAKLIKACPIWANLAKIEEVYLEKPEGMVVDHIIPLQGKLVSGLHIHTNLQYLTPIENGVKSNKFGLVA